jgi:ABC-2 type transport system ATP-binding protein
VTAAIAVEGLTKLYGDHAAIDGVSFEVARGEVVGFLGPNGAGKSTTLKILAGFLGATSGRARIDGYDVVEEPDEARRRTGYMPENVPLYPEMRVREYLKFRAEVKRVPSWQRKGAVERAMGLARVEDVADTLIDHLSKGYRQRVGLADALVARPPLLVLDEPTAGMDPNQIRDVRALVRDLGGEHTILLSTHILSEVEATCSRVLVIDRGKLVAEGDPATLGGARGGRRLEIVVRGDAAELLQMLLADGLPAETKIAGTKSEGEIVRLKLEISRIGDLGAAAEEMVDRLVRHGFAIREVVATKTSLEDVFAQVTQGEDDLEDEERTEDAEEQVREDEAENDSEGESEGETEPDTEEDAPPPDDEHEAHGDHDEEEES